VFFRFELYYLLRRRSRRITPFTPPPSFVRGKYRTQIATKINAVYLFVKEIAINGDCYNINYGRGRVLPEHTRYTNTRSFVLLSTSVVRERSSERSKTTILIKYSTAVAYFDLNFRVGVNFLINKSDDPNETKHVIHFNSIFVFNEHVIL